MKFCTEPVFVDPRQVTAVVCLNFSHFLRYIQDRCLKVTDRRFVCITSRRDCVSLYGHRPVKVAIVSEPLDMLEIAEELQRFVDQQTLDDLVRYYQYRMPMSNLIREQMLTTTFPITNSSLA